ncbi:MAG: hypothetical protein WBD20_01225, partial [Pirellulaceae bacterium]
CDRAPISSMNCPAYRRPRISPSVVIPPISSLADRAPIDRASFVRAMEAKSDQPQRIRVALYRFV